MSKINDLIKELCPNGVEFKKIIDIAEVGTGSSNRQDAVEDGVYPFYVRSKEVFRINKFEYDEEAIIIPGEGGIGEIFHYVNGKYALHQRAYRIHIVDIRMMTKFLYYYMFNSFKDFIMLKAVNATVTSIRKPMIEQFSVPIPPIEVQEEIIRILDKFSELEAELEAELEVRKNQYEFWRGKVFDVKGETKTYKLEEVLKSLKTGLNPRKFFRLNTEDADGYYVTVREIGDRNVRYWESKDRVNKDGLLRINERANLEIGDVLFSGTGTIGRVSLIEETPDNWNVKEGVYILKPKKEIINPVYLMHLMRSDYMKKLYSDYIVGSPVSSVPMRDLKNVEFELPDLETQERISNILDKFDKLINDITVGLPAEIELRRKQYEYYRNKLLSFEELSVSE